MKNRKYIYLSLILFCYSSLTACSSLTQFVNYTHKYGPRYAFSGRARHHQVSGKNIKVVSYNIKHAKKINEAVTLLKEQGLADADIILLQEMTSKGVKKMADALNYDYVFYPAVRHPILKTGFGNAVLSKWPILNDHKVILPQTKPNARHRIAVGATVLINNKEVVVYSLHMGIFVNPIQRKKIVNALIDSLPETTEYCIIAGDFNTFTQKDREYIARSFSESDFNQTTSNIDWTYSQWYFFNRKSKLDHIFTKGMRKINAGRIIDRSPSDHLPVWAELAFRETE